MYCTKCGKKANSADVYCSACGTKLNTASETEVRNKKSSNWIVLLLCAAVLIFAAGKMMGGNGDSGLAPFEPAKERDTITLQDAQVNANELLPEEPKDGDILENSDYADGTPRRRVSGGDIVDVWDYRPDGTTLRYSSLAFLEGKICEKYITNYDEHGNPLDTTQTTADGELWLYMFYVNEYDDQGRPLILSQYNRMGNPLYTYVYTYNPDGSYTQEFTEYRGYVYEYDREYNPEGTTSMWSQSITTFSPEGDVIDQYIIMADGVEQ